MASSRWPTLVRVHWDRMFEDLEGQLASEWEAERAALSAESERLRISRLELRTRLRTLCAAGAPVTLELAGGQRHPALLRDLGADWLAAEHAPERARGRPEMSIVPLHAVAGLRMDHGLLLTSLEEQPPMEASLRDRMTLGFILRDLARRRVAVRIDLLHGGEVHGTIDRAGADHLDLAVHDPGEARRIGAVHEFRIVPIPAILRLRPIGEARLA